MTMKQKWINRLLLWLLAGVSLVGCKTHKVPTDIRPTDQYLTSRLQLKIPHNETVFTVNGTLKMKSGEIIQVSLLMPVIRSEVARIETNPTDVLLIDRMGRRYVRATWDELKSRLPKNVDYRYLEEKLLQAARPGGNSKLSGSELGIRRLAKAQVELYEFATNPVQITPTQVPSRYEQVSVDEILKLLLSL